MRKYLFIGNTNENTGPANVNKGIRSIYHRIFVLRLVIISYASI